MGAGVDSMIHEPSLPRHVPLLRVIDPLSECIFKVNERCLFASERASRHGRAAAACRRPLSA